MKIQKTIFALALVALSGCGSVSPEEMQNTASVVRSDARTGNRTVERFIDQGCDGSVDIYIVGVPSKDDPTFPDKNIARNPRAFLRQAYLEWFKRKHGLEGEGFAISYSGESGITRAWGVPAEVMTPKMQEAVDTKYHLMVSNPEGTK